MAIIQVNEVELNNIQEDLEGRPITVQRNVSKHNQSACPIDGKWAVVVAIAAFIGRLIVAGQSSSMPIFTVEWEERLGVTPSQVSWATTLVTGLRFATGMIHNAKVISSMSLKGDLRTICRFSYMKVYKLITLGTKFKTLLSLGRKITMFSKFITNYIEQGWWHSSLTLKCMHLLLKEVNKRGRHAYNLHGWTCLPSGIVMEIHCHITGIFEAAVRLRLPSCCSV